MVRKNADEMSWALINDSCGLVKGRRRKYSFCVPPKNKNKTETVKKKIQKIFIEKKILKMFEK